MAAVNTSTAQLNGIRTPHLVPTPATRIRNAESSLRDVKAALTSFFIRCLDLIIAIPGCMLALVIYALFGFLPPIGRRRIGQFGNWFREWAWTDLRGHRARAIRKLHLDALPRMVNLLLGDITLVGPALHSMPVEPPELVEYMFCKSIRPGLISLFGLRKLTNIHFAEELQTELHFVRTYSLSSVLGILARYPLAAIYGRGRTKFDKEITVLRIRIDNLLMKDAVAWILQHILQRTKPAQVSFVNAHCANVASKSEEYRQSLLHSRLVLADGIGMRLAGNLLGRPIRQNVNGTDMLPLLCAELARIQGSIFLLGGEPGTATEVAGWISKQYPNVKIAGTESGFFPEAHTENVVRKINDAAPDLLLVAMGVPRQELWIARNLEACGARVAIGVGGLFEFYSSRIPRAPMWMRELGLEWTHRLTQEPRRMWRRYLLGNFTFLYKVFRELIRSERSAEALR